MSNKVHEKLDNSHRKTNYNRTTNYNRETDYNNSLKDNYYDSISKGYEELHKEEQLNKINIIKQHINIKPNSKILDLGCGPYFSEWHKDKHNKNLNCEVTGLDPSNELLKLAAKKGINPVLGKAESLPFPNNYFDYVFSITAIQNFDDVEKALKEIKRVIKKSSEVVITILKTSAKKEAITNLIRKHFNITKVIEEDKDIILFIKT
ncbi:methyltransferase domain-containing protein [Candidatus Woesearchaeota archaeon]|nr:methyltransferase domain-containing protein [Candidatus Woesearchaeota archaeon]